MSPGKKASSGSPTPEAAEAATAPSTEATSTEAASPEADPDPQFSYKTAGAGIVIFWHGRQIKTVGGASGASLRRKLTDADDATAQGLLARASGNFKRGNELRH